MAFHSKYMGDNVKKVAFHNLGCKVNSYEIEVMQQKMLEQGYHIVSFDEAADIYIVNTCTVTNIADRKSRQLLHRARQRNPGAVVVAVGCYVQTGLNVLEQDDSVDLAIGNNRKKDIVEILERYLKVREGGGPSCEKGAAAHEADKTLGGTTVPDIAHTYEYEEMQLKQTAEHTRAYIKIQDGCNQFCSYCAIPLARGRVRSRRAEDILTEVHGMVKAGYREVVLTGIHISSYGIDFDSGQWEQGRSVPARRGELLEYSGNSRLMDLIEQVHRTEGLERLRLGSLEPRIITAETAERLAALPKLCPHFHLSLQSGCDTTLKRMNRHYTVGEYYESVEHLRRAFGFPAITTDVIVGFPGETEEEFEQTQAFLEKVGFYEMHIFKYSRRDGTVAANLKDQVPEEIKNLRSEQLFQLEKMQSQSFRSRYIGREAEILLEETKEIQGQCFYLGHTKDYVKIAVPYVENVDIFRSGQILKVAVGSFLTDEILQGEVG